MTTIYSAAAADIATHTIEVFRGEARFAMGEDFGHFFAGDVQASDTVLAWLENQGVSLDDPDLWVLVVADGEGPGNRPIAVLPIAPVAEPAPELVAEQTAVRNRGGRPSIAEDGDTARVVVTLSRNDIDILDDEAAKNGTTRAALMRTIIRASMTSTMAQPVALSWRITPGVKARVNWTGEAYGDTYVQVWVTAEWYAGASGAAPLELHHDGTVRTRSFAGPVDGIIAGMLRPHVTPDLVDQVWRAANAGQEFWDGGHEGPAPCSCGEILPAAREPRPWGACEDCTTGWAES